MPEISRFFGIVIRMFRDEHPPPHFHATYGGVSASISIDSATVIAGRLPPRIVGFVAEWATIHRAELRQNWKLVMAGQPLKPIAPLE